ncbi:MAG: exodeoxyribonuclease III [Bacilli bacterium]|jgi:exodeoxyribonuclease-3|nr:exodeoxyribonuclease III [Bacilli bacterium]MDY0064313.1 exodeoxyribonuclease III [Bacilli bacterium]
MKFVSWNVNGLRACMKKGFSSFFEEMNADIFSVQETKMQEDQKDFTFHGYYEYWNSADKKGYSGTLIYTKQKPLQVRYGIDGKYNDEGRLITLEFENFYYITVYVPNSQRELTRLAYRMEFEDDFRAYLIRLDQHKPVIVCGDLNVAHQEIDLKNPKENERNAGFTIEERTKFQLLLDSGFVDTFRFLNPNKVQYSWWSYMFQARMKDIGWRIDYYVISRRLSDQIKNSIIYSEIMGSDHCPVSIEIF